MSKFPISEFIKISVKNIKSSIKPRYTDKCILYPIINDKKGQRWLCDIKKGFKLESHKHLGRYEWFILSGRHKFKNIETGKSCILEAGDYYCNPAGVPHSDECLESGKVLWIYDMEEDPEEINI